MVGIITMPRNIIWGRGSLSHLKNIEGKRALIVTDRTMVRLGVVSESKNYLKKAGFEISIFDDVEPQPSINTVMRILQQHQDFNPDVVVGLGGGSPIDASKAFRIFFECPQLMFADIRGGSPKIHVPRLKKTISVAVPSTSGTGSEATHAAAITDPSVPAKYLILSHEIIPSIAILDPDIADSQPPMILAHSGIDTLANSIESLVNRNANSFTLGLSQESFKLSMKSLLPAYLHNDKEAKEQMHYAATLAGIAACNAGVTIGHTIGDVVGGSFKLSHGLAVGISLPFSIKYNSTIAAGRYMDTTKAIGYNGNSMDEAVNYLIQKICEVREKIKIPGSYQETGISEKVYLSRLKGFVNECYDFPSCTLNPRKPTPEELETLFIACYRGDYGLI